MVMAALPGPWAVMRRVRRGNESQIRLVRRGSRQTLMHCAKVDVASALWMSADGLSQKSVMSPASRHSCHLPIIQAGHKAKRVLWTYSVPVTCCHAPCKLIQQGLR